LAGDSTITRFFASDNLAGDFFLTDGFFAFATTTPF